MTQHKHRVHISTDETRTIVVLVATWDDDAFYHDESAASVLWNKKFKTSPGRHSGGDVVDVVREADALSAATAYAAFVANQLSCDVLDRR